MATFSSHKAKANDFDDCIHLIGFLAVDRELLAMWSLDGVATSSLGTLYYIYSIWHNVCP